jgi:hypothetical protein
VLEDDAEVFADGGAPRRLKKKAASQMRRPTQ